MDVRRLKESQVVDWKCLPEIATLCQYLELADLKELSMTCKRYRNQNESRILENLNLTRYHDCCQYCTLNDSHMDIDNYSGTYLDIMEKDLKDKYQLVKGIRITYNFKNDHFAKKVIDLFPHITKLKIGYENYDCDDYEENGVDILNIFKGMKHVEHIEFSNDRDYFPSFDIVNEHIFSKSLKSLTLNLAENNQQFLAIFDTIDSSYVNLTKITIATNKLLANLSFNILKLTVVLDNGYLHNDLVLKFLKNCHQLKGLELKLYEYSYELFDTILSSNCLSYLNIEICYSRGLEFNRDFRLNYSIKKLEIYDVPCSLTSKLIKSCQNLESIEFKIFHFREEHKSIWDNFDRRINTLTFNYCVFEECASYIQTIEKLDFFNQAIFISCKPIGNIIEHLNLDKLNNYKLNPKFDENSNYCVITHI